MVVRKVVDINELSIGDVVIVAWKDHYRTHNSSAEGSMMVESFGRVGEITDNGDIVLFQNRITNVDEIQRQGYCTNGNHFSPLHECMDGQLILKECVISARVLEKA